MFFTWTSVPETLLSAYTEYLERVFLDSKDLVTVDLFTVPTNVSLPLLSEWADVD